MWVEFVVGRGRRARAATILPACMHICMHAHGGDVLRGICVRGRCTRQRMGAKGVNRMISVGLGCLAGAVEVEWCVWMCTATGVGWIGSLRGDDDDDDDDDDGENAEKGGKEGGNSARESCLRK